MFNGVLGIYRDKFEFLDSVFEELDLFFDIGIFARELSILTGNEINLKLKRFEEFLKMSLFFLIDEINFTEIILFTLSLQLFDLYFVEYLLLFFIILLCELFILFFILCL